MPNEPTNQDEITQEEYDEVVEELREAQEEIKELKKRPETGEVDTQIETLNTELEAKDEEIVQLKADLKEAEEATEDLDLGLKLLRQDVLDSYAEEQGLSKYGRDNDEGYSDLKKKLESVESIGSLIRRRKRYDSGKSLSSDSIGAKTTRRSRNTYEESNFADVPVPGTPGASAYSE